MPDHLRPALAAVVRAWAITPGETLHADAASCVVAANPMRC